MVVPKVLYQLDLTKLYSLTYLHYIKLLLIKFLKTAFNHKAQDKYKT